MPSAPSHQQPSRGVVLHPTRVDGIRNISNGGHMTPLEEQDRCWVMPWRGRSLEMPEEGRREALDTKGFS